ncbi:putative sensor histidine kinase pdtaS [Jeotgalibaca dankookensis]|uniref:histidine kinase n=1 Tax=Jeotgalibaca dankookensis TaxID=708126 RepID=A0A1S6IMJ3_9LACT|nr:sensor histidine kinase [Jeotgalibaca dankookensis]AQS52756.1 putative sensor histidine kinase pdtaS [Jeotgalibaca dankookensis]
MNNNHYDEDIQEICKKYTQLSKVEIQYLENQAEIILTNRTFDEFDVFIDVRNVFTGEAIVVSHRKPSNNPSIYEKRVVGKTAYRKDEPGPLRTLETSQNSIGLYARSQEGLLIKQTTYPIQYKDKTIAVLIVEKDLSNDIKANFDVSNLDRSYEEVSAVIEEMEIIDQSITNYIDDAILIFDENGLLQHHNKAANEYYQNFGYLNAINGLHYDNLALDLTTFEHIRESGTLGKPEAFKSREIKFDAYYFKIKTIYLPSKGIVIQIMKDISDKKAKESRIISELVTIQEIHHRVKNNLQTVVSLLRLQARRAESPEAKKVLNESVNRILSIAATHELLSKQKEDDVQLKMVLDVIIQNLTRFYAEGPDGIPVQLTSEIDSSIILESNKAVTIALATNELIQNCFDHAFEGIKQENAHVKVEVTQENEFIQIIIEDNGSGFIFEERSQHNLGLQIVTSFVEGKLNGIISTDSKSQGTRFRIAFKN